MKVPFSKGLSKSSKNTKQFELYKSVQLLFTDYPPSARHLTGQFKKRHPSTLQEADTKLENVVLAW